MELNKEKKHPFEGWDLTFPDRNGFYRFSFRDSFVVRTSHAYGVDVKLDLYDMEGNVSLRILAHFLNKIADAKAEPTIEQLLTSKGQETFKKCVAEVEALMPPTREQIQKYYDS